MGKWQELRQLHGVGDILAKRFCEAGLDSFAKISAAGAEGLGKIKGINPRAIPGILQQAGGLAEDGRKQRVQELKKAALGMKEQVQGMAVTIKERFQQELAGRPGKKLEKDLLQVVDALEQIESKLETKAKKAGKSLVKAEKKLTGLLDGGFRQLRKGLKKARKSLQKV